MDRKEQIRKAAINIMAEHGFYKSTIEMIAREADISVGTIYNYFNIKEDILGYIFEVECKSRVTFLEKLIENDEPPAEKLRAFFKMHFEHIRKNPALAKLMMQELKFSGRDEFKSLKRFHFNILELLTSIAAECKREKCSDERILGTVIFGALQALTMQFLFKEDNLLKGDLNPILDQLVSLFT